MTFFVNGVVAAKHTGCKFSGGGVLPMICTEGANQFVVNAGAAAFAFPVPSAEPLLSLRLEAGGQPGAPLCARVDGSIFFSTPGSVAAHNVTALCVEAAVRMAKLPTAQQSIVSRSNDSSGFSLAVGADGVLVLSCGGQTFASGAHVLVAGVWQHVAATCSGRAVTLLVNGEVVLQADSTVKPGCSDVKLLVGGPVPPARGFVGDIAFVRLWNEALVPTVIHRNMKREAAVARSASRGGLVSEWLFSETGGKVALDTGGANAGMEGPRHVQGIARARARMPLHLRW